jgi:hypothetical protein
MRSRLSLECFLLEDLPSRPGLPAQMTYLMHGHQYADEWLQTPQFVCGVCVFACGMAANIHADSVLINLVCRLGSSKS